MARLDDLRAKFEAHMPLPAGVVWIGEHYSGSSGQMGSFRNASEWDAMFRGYLLSQKPMVGVDQGLITQQMIDDAAKRFDLTMPFSAIRNEMPYTKKSGGTVPKELVTPELIKVHIQGGKFVALESTKGPTK